MDKLLRGEGIRFCRLSMTTGSSAIRRKKHTKRLIFLSEKLFNEGLFLQKTKTRILTAKEFMDESKLLMKWSQADEENLAPRKTSCSGLPFISTLIPIRALTTTKS